LASVVDVNPANIHTLEIANVDPILQRDVERKDLLHRYNFPRLPAKSAIG
jgi:hypothetical protein